MEFGYWWVWMNFFRFIVVGFFWLFLAFSGFVFAELDVKLKADHFFFREEDRVMVASSNVRLSYGDVVIEGPQLYLDVDRHVAWGTGNIVIKRGDDEFHSETFYYDLSADSLVLEKIDLTIRPPDSQANLFLHADRIADHGDIKKGTGGFITSCDLDQPHYFLRAEYFDYTPDQRILGKNVVLYNPLLGVPFGLWFPYYNYEIGKRKIIWNFPTIGKKEAPGWGWFVQNTIDYDHLNGEDSSVFIDWFENKGIGYGIRHQYSFFDNRNRGTLLGYQLQEADTGQNNSKYQWKHAVDVSDELSLNWSFLKMDAERISFSGREEKEDKSLEVLYDDLGDSYKFRVSDFQNFRQNFGELNFGLDRSFNQEKEYTFSLKQQDSFPTNKRQIQSDFTHYHRLPGDANLTNRLNFSEEGAIHRTASSAEDTLLKTYTTYTKTFDPSLKMTLKTDLLFDLEEGRVTSDSNSSKNDFFYRVPELSLIYTNPNIASFTFTEEIIVARYQEVQFNSLKNAQITFPNASEFGVEPNAYIFKQKLSRTLTKLPNDSTLTLSAGLDQYTFKTPGKGLFEGDAMYLYDLNTSYTSRYFGFLKSSTRYQRLHVDSDSNAPFQYFNRIKGNDINQVSETLTFYVENENKFHWFHTAGYNWDRRKWDFYKTGILVKPNTRFELKVDTGIVDFAKAFDLGLPATERISYLPLNWNLALNPTSNIGFNYYLSQDLNFGTVKNSNFSLKFALGGPKAYSWEIETLFAYDPVASSSMRSLALGRYAMQTIRVIKNAHCRRFTISYNKALKEFSFKYTILAFPNDQIGFKKTEDIWKIEGILDEKTEERF